MIGPSPYIARRPGSISTPPPSAGVTTPGGAIFSQITGAQRDEGKTHDDTFIYFREKNHWAWFIPIDRDVVSVGVVVPADYLRSKEKDQRAFLLRELREINPELARRLQSIEIVDEVRSRPNYSFHIKEFTGPNYLCVGDCHRFIDPVFSFGLFLTMKEAEIAAKAVKGFFDGDHRNDENPFAGYQAYCDGTLDAVEAVVDGFKALQCVMAAKGEGEIADW